MTRRTRLADLARITLVDATATARYIDTALHALDESGGGYPATTPGASPASGSGSSECHHPECSESTPCPIHDPDGNVTMTVTERMAFTPDKAVADLAALDEAIRKQAHWARHAATLATRWANRGRDETAVREDLVSMDRETWCTNCSQWNHKEPRLPGQLECAFCAEFRRDYKRPAPKAVLDIKAYKKQVSVQDKQRVLNQIDPNWRKKLKRGKAA